MKQKEWEKTMNAYIDKHFKVSEEQRRKLNDVAEKRRKQREEKDGIQSFAE